MSETQDDVMQLVAAAHFLRDQPKAEAHYYSKVIAEVAQRMLASAPVAQQEPTASAACPICGQSSPHQHSPAEIVQHKNAVKKQRVEIVDWDAFSTWADAHFENGCVAPSGIWEAWLAARDYYRDVAPVAQQEHVGQVVMYPNLSTIVHWNPIMPPHGTKLYAAPVAPSEPGERK